MNKWVAKSALQKAFRRNHKKLLIEAFEVCWGNDQDWVLRRAMIFAAEDAWKSSLAIGRELYALQLGGHLTVKGDKDIVKDRMLAVLVEQAATEKNKDANNLRQVARSIVLTSTNKSTEYANSVKRAVKKRVSEEDYNNLQWMIMATRKLYGTTNYRQAAKVLWGALWNLVEEESGSVDYQLLRDAVGALYFRHFQGGCVDTHLLLLCAGLRVVTVYSSDVTNINPYGIRAKPSNIRKVSDSFGDKSSTWWVSDMHTSKGKKVLTQMYAKYPQYTEDFLSELWFLKETALVNKDDPDSVWLTLQANIYYKLEGVSPKDIDSIWNTIGQDIKMAITGQ